MEIKVSFPFTCGLCFSPCGNFLQGETVLGEAAQFCFTKLLETSKRPLCDSGSRSQPSDVKSLAKRVAEDRLIGQGLVSQLIPLTAGSAAVTVGQTGHRALRALKLKRNGELSLSELDQDGQLATRSVSRLPAWAMQRSKCIRVASVDHTGGAINVIFTSKPQDRYDVGQPARDEDYAAIYRREEAELQPWLEQSGEASGTKRKLIQMAGWNCLSRGGLDEKRRSIETSSLELAGSQYNQIDVDAP